MATKNISWTPTEKKVYEQILEHKKEFFIACAKQSDCHRLYTFHATTGWQMEVFNRYAKSSPNYGDALICIGRGFHTTPSITKENVYGTGGRTGTKGWDADDYVDFLEKLHERFWDAIMKRAGKMGNKVLQDTHTQRILELIARGFVWSADYMGSKYRAYTPYNLVWPKTFDTEEAAIEHLQKYGIGECYYQ